MTDTTDDVPATEEATATPETGAETAVRRAAKGQDDDGQVVSGAAGEMFYGAIADVTDNEPGRKKKKK